MDPSGAALAESPPPGKCQMGKARLWRRRWEVRNDRLPMLTALANQLWWVSTGSRKDGEGGGWLPPRCWRKGASRTGGLGLGARRRRRRPTPVGQGARLTAYLKARAWRTEPPRRPAECTPRPWGCSLIWKQGPCRLMGLKLGLVLHPKADVLIRRPCEDREAHGGEEPRRWGQRSDISQALRASPQARGGREGSSPGSAPASTLVPHWWPPDLSE